MKTILLCLALVACIAAEPSTQPLNDKVVKSDAEWKKILDARAVSHPSREGHGTRVPQLRTSRTTTPGDTYVRRASWNCLRRRKNTTAGPVGPSFFQPAAAQRVSIGKDADGDRDEVVCARCGGTSRSRV